MSWVREEFNIPQETSKANETIDITESENQFAEAEEIESQDFSTDCNCGQEVSLLAKAPGEFTPPEAGENAPQEIKDILKEVYGECRSKWSEDNPDDIDNKSNKQSCASIAWTAVKNAGWKKDSEGNWEKSKKASKFQFQVDVDYKLKK